MEEYEINIALQEIEEEIDEIVVHNCTYDCICVDNGVDCDEKCPVKLIIDKLRAKADRLLNE